MSDIVQTAHEIEEWWFRAMTYHSDINSNRAVTALAQSDGSRPTRSPLSITSFSTLFAGWGPRIG